MEQSQSNYTLLIQKLDQFIRRYYVNKLIRGVLYSLGLLLAIFLLINVLEYNFYFDTSVRKFMFYGFLLTSVVAVGYWIIVPLAKYLGLGSTISHEQAANIIGDHFGNVKDRLLNVLQLKQQADSAADTSLLTASIEQKTDAIKLVPFRKAIDLSKNRKYLKYAVPPALLLLGILFAAPSIIKDGTHRLVHNNEKFEKAAPFSFVLAEQNPTIVQFDDYNLDVKVEGDILPAEAFVEVDGFQYRLKKEGQDRFTYTFRNVQKDTPFRVFSGSVSAARQTLSVLAKPNLSNFSIELDYPKYTGRSDEKLDNIGDVTVPQGTKARWYFTADHTDAIKMSFASEKEARDAKRKGTAQFLVSKRLLRDDNYKVLLSNKNVPYGDSMQYVVNVIKDGYPTIKAEEIKDSTDNISYFIGQASDDYGLSTLTFHYTITDEKGRANPKQAIPLKRPDGREIQYTHTFDLDALKLAPGDEVSYYFEVKDNDAVNGSKAAKTSVMKYAKLTIEEFEEEENLNEEAIKDNLREANKNMEKLQEQFKKMKEKLLDKKELDWKDKKELEKLLEEQKMLNEKLQDAKEKFDQNLEKQQEYKQQEEKLQEKQERLQELFEEALDPQKQELLEKIQEMMQELNKDNALEMMEQMEMNNETLDKEMDRLEELYKQLEMEKEVSDMIEDLEKLAEKQEELAEKTEEQKTPEEQLKKEQDKLNKEFESLEKELEELEEKNEELSPPKDLGEHNEEQMEDIEQEMKDAQKQLDKKDSKGASKSQKDAAQKLKKMASSMQSSMQGGDQEQQKEDIKMIRQLLENLVTLSFDQEDLINDFTQTSTVTPRYVELIQDQYVIKNNFKIAEDSLTALANRNDKIESFVLEKVSEVKSNMTKGVEELAERQKSKASVHQRKTMKNLNDLALMLEESMENMQQSMSSGMPGSQMCQKPSNKPGGKPGKEPSDKLSKGSEGVSDKLKGMIDKMKKGGKNSSRDFAEAAARQAALRKALEDLKKDAQEQGKSGQELNDIIDELNKIEIDLVNKRLDGEMLKRQHNITTRLLEAEKADRQREYDNKRKAEKGSDKKRTLPPPLQEYLKQREAEIEMYKSVSPSLRPYYKSLVDKYYKALKAGE